MDSLAALANAIILVMLAASSSGCIGAQEAGDSDDPRGPPKEAENSREIAEAGPDPEESNLFDLPMLRNCVGAELQLRSTVAGFPFEAPSGWEVGPERQIVAYDVVAFRCDELVWSPTAVEHNVSIAFEAHTNLSWKPGYNVDSTRLSAVLGVLTDSSSLDRYLAERHGIVEVGSVQVDSDGRRGSIRVEKADSYLEIQFNHLETGRTDYAHQSHVVMVAELDHVLEFDKNARTAADVVFTSIDTGGGFYYDQVGLIHGSGRGDGGVWIEGDIELGVLP